MRSITFSEKFSVAAAVALLCAGGAGVARADDLKFTATVDRESISLDETVSLKLSVESDGNTRTGQPQYEAPDFEEISEYSGTSINSYYDNGRFGMKTTQTLTRILRPAHKGTLRISKIRIDTGGRTLTAPDVVVEVTAGGAGTPQGSNTQGGGGAGLRGTHVGNNAIVMVRAEINKPRVYKGEQLIVSYYLYSRVRLNNLQADKIPVLNGFLREDIDVPVLNRSQLDTELEIVGGVQYRKSLLARYAAYPLQEGKLKIDTLGVKYTYYPNRGGGMYDDEDPFTNFFQSLAPRPGSDKSQDVTVEVMPVPEAGKPPSFTGGVGDFTVSSTVNKTEVRANEAVAMTFKVEGRGNLAAIGEPKVKWPANTELYESKGHVNTGRAGVGEKAFEFLLIPRVPGKLTLPEMEMSFFDPTKGAYVTRTSRPIEINVLEGAPGSAAPPPASSNGNVARPSQPSPAKDAVSEAPRPLRPPGAAVETDIHGNPVWRWVYWLFVAFLGIFSLLVLRDRVSTALGRNRKMAAERAASEAKSFKALRGRAQGLGSGGAQEVSAFYDSLAGTLLDALDRKYGVGARSLSRARLEELLVGERGLRVEVWTRIRALLEYAEAVQFAGLSAQAGSDARTRAVAWVDEAEAVVKALD